MPWQQLIADVGGELLENGQPAYREVIFTVPRQSGKTTLILAWQLQRALGWGKPQHIVYSAQTGSDARKKLIEDQVPLLQPHQKTLAIRRILRANGNEAVEFLNGSRISVMASGADSGHGKTIDLAIRDEFFADVDDRRDQALVPAMATRRDAQVLTASTAGTDESIPLNRAIARGRALAAAGDTTSGVAYFEWSAEADADADDEATWLSCMPALGHTITTKVVAHARATLTDGEFRRAFLNVSTRSDDRLISYAAWQAVQSPTAAPEGNLTMAVDVNADRDAAAIVVADTTGTLELIQYERGLSWLIPRLIELNEKYHPTWVADGSNSAPISALLPEIERQSLKIARVPSTEYPAACGSFFDAVVNRKLKVRTHSALDAAVAGAGRRITGDAFTWKRRGLVDISPLVAATLALWVQPKAKPKLFVY